jgi:MHS family proline/betaine transporter-like MFS transporter
MELAANQKLTRDQKEALGLLSIGTFLEYFDLMLYVHMAVLLNELFFPEADPKTASIIAAMSFCSTFLFRPIGALIFGYIGDTFGRKNTVVLTTFLMSGSCLLMASVPTYAEIGYSAAIIVTVCRIVQGMSSMGEKVGAELYLTESVKAPMRYPLVAMINVFSSLGAVGALVAASIFTMYGLNWRYAFVFGAGIALIGTFARTALRETPDFADAKHKLKEDLNELGGDNLKTKSLLRETTPTKTLVSYFLLQCARPVCFYFVYVHCSNILTNNFNCTPEEIIRHNLVVAVIDFFGVVFLTYLSYYIHPLKIVKTIAVIFTVSLIFVTYGLSHITSPFQLMLLQCFFCLLAIDTAPAAPVFLIHIPVFKRFTVSTLLYALSRALIYFATSFGFVYFTDQFNDFGLLIIMIPVIIGFFYAILHFEKLEKKAGNYY